MICSSVPDQNPLGVAFGSYAALRYDAVSRKAVMFLFIFKGAPFGNQNAKGSRGTKSLSGKDAIKILKKHGWEVARVTGSHHIMKRPGRPPLPVPAHGTDLGIGLLKSLQKQLGFTF